MSIEKQSTTGQYIHIVSLRCKSVEHALQCIDALENYGRPNAMEYGCLSYEFGRNVQDDRTVILIERWDDFSRLDRLLAERVVPALPTYNALLERDFDPSTDTRRIALE